MIIGQCSICPTRHGLNMHHIDGRANSVRKVVLCGACHHALHTGHPEIRAKVREFVKEFQTGTVKAKPGGKLVIV